MLIVHKFITSQRLLPNVLYQAVARDSETAASRIDVIDDVHLFVRLSVCLSVCRQNAKNAIFSKTKQFRAMMSIDDL